MNGINERLFFFSAQIGVIGVIGVIGAIIDAFARKRRRYGFKPLLGVVIQLGTTSAATFTASATFTSATAASAATIFTRSATSATSFTGSATGSASFAAATTSSCREIGAQFVVGEFAVLVFVEFFQCGHRVFDFLGGDFAILVGVQGNHERQHAHHVKSAAATGSTLAWSPLAGSALAGSTLAWSPLAGSALAGSILATATAPTTATATLTTSLWSLFLLTFDSPLSSFAPLGRLGNGHTYG